MTPCVTKFIGYSVFHKRVYMWDVNNGEIIKELNIEMNHTECVFSPQGTKLVSSTGNNIHVYEWDALNS